MSAAHTCDSDLSIGLNLSETIEGSSFPSSRHNFGPKLFSEIPANANSIWLAIAIHKVQIITAISIFTWF